MIIRMMYLIESSLEEDEIVYHLFITLRNLNLYFVPFVCMCVCVACIHRAQLKNGFFWLKLFSLYKQL